MFRVKKNGPSSRMDPRCLKSLCLTYPRPRKMASVICWPANVVPSRRTSAQNQFQNQFQFLVVM